MGLVPWKARGTGVDLFDNLEDFQREMNRLFDLKLHRVGHDAQMWAPAVDIVDEKDQIRVKADIPGMKREDIEVNVENDMLTIRGKKKEEKETKEKDVLRCERYYGSFQRSLSLPASFNASKVNAVYKDGVLEITLPKKEGAKPKQMKVEVK